MGLAEREPRRPEAAPPGVCPPRLHRCHLRRAAGPAGSGRHLGADGGPRRGGGCAEERLGCHALGGLQPQVRLAGAGAQQSGSGLEQNGDRGWGLGTLNGGCGAGPRLFGARGALRQTGQKAPGHAPPRSSPATFPHAAPALCPACLCCPGPAPRARQPAPRHRRCLPQLARRPAPVLLASSPASASPHPPPGPTCPPPRSTKSLLYISLCLDPRAAASGVVQPVDCPWDMAADVPSGAECAGDLTLLQGSQVRVVGLGMRVDVCMYCSCFICLCLHVCMCACVVDWGGEKAQSRAEAGPAHASSRCAAHRCFAGGLVAISRRPTLPATPASCCSRPRTAPPTFQLRWTEPTQRQTWGRCLAAAAARHPRPESLLLTWQPEWGRPPQRSAWGRPAKGRPMAAQTGRALGWTPRSTGRRAPARPATWRRAAARLATPPWLSLRMPRWRCQRRPPPRSRAEVRAPAPAVHHQSRPAETARHSGWHAGAENLLARLAAAEARARLPAANRPAAGCSPAAAPPVQAMRKGRRLPPAGRRSPNGGTSTLVALPWARALLSSRPWPLEWATSHCRVRRRLPFLLRYGREEDQAGVPP